MKRSAITILEVLIAIGVVSIGLFGVMAVLPLAVKRANQSTTLDDAAACAANAVDEFQIRDMGRTRNWVNTAGNQIGPATAPGYCIDPLFVAQLHAASAGNDPARFPYDDQGNAALAMQRISLRSNPGAADPDMLDPSTADLIFTLRNDLQFSPPDENNRNAVEAPVQEYIVDGNPQKRAIQGRTTWFATLNQSGSNNWNLSIVVCHNRDFDMTIANDASTVPEQRRQNEHAVSISTFYSNGYRGGDCQLRGPTPESIEVRTSDWVMLSARSTVGNPITRHRWYRVAASDPAAQQIGPTDWRRDVTLQGSDWNASTPGMGNPQVTFVRNVVAVYEKTIRRDTGFTSPLWAD